MKGADLSGIWTCLFSLLNCVRHVGTSSFKALHRTDFPAFVQGSRVKRAWKCCSRLCGTMHCIWIAGKEIFPLGFDRRHTAKCQCDSRLLRLMGFKPFFFVREDVLTVVTTLCSSLAHRVKLERKSADANVYRYKQLHTAFCRGIQILRLFEILHSFPTFYSLYKEFYVAIHKAFRRHFNNCIVVTLLKGQHVVIKKFIIKYII